MRRALLFLALALCACDRRPAPAGAGKGLVILNPVGDRPTYFDLGRVPRGAKAEHVFRIRNDDPRPVTVKDLLASCGCAVPRISYRAADGALVPGNPDNRETVITLPPGAVADLAVSIDTERVEVMNIDKLAQVRVRSDSKTTPYVTLELHLVVERLMRAVPAAIELGQTPQSAGKSGRTDVAVDVPGCRARVIGVESVEGPFTATVDEAEVAGVATWIVVANARPGIPLGPVAGKVVLSVTGADGTGVGRPFSVTVTAQIAPDVVLRPPVLLFGSFERGKPAKIEAQLVALVPGERVLVRSATVTGTPESAAREIAAEVTPIDPGEDGRAQSWMVVLRSSEKLRDSTFSGELTLQIDHPRVPSIRAVFSGATH
jgi:hypothetical protein